ncbi:hypothetical protein PVK06_008146 [Gossypium arboreum]|uniref:RNase H type-1 domain-containing protein n=1 Tax=Gossypium arboreum TaxID=29729 RepID=A0ABR0QJ86_GOSAR|nr:hypothetical protein PVK06_008146 [Gossypium arboreum]
MLAWGWSLLSDRHGRLGFCDLRLFNVALLSKQVWRLIHFKNTLCFKVLSSKYLASGYIFHRKNVDKLSYTWTSIATAAKTLANGFSWLVGDGISIKICNGNWGFEGLNGDSLCPTLLSDNEGLVSDLWNHNFTGWNNEKVCPRCGKEEKTLIYALKDYLKVRAILTLSDLDNRLLESDYSCGIDWIEDIMRILDMKVVADFFTTLWNSWNNRNNFIFWGQDEDAKTVWEKDKTLFREFKIHNLVNAPMLPITPACKKWDKPPCGFAKINFDVTVANEKMDYGVIVRDADGFVLVGSEGFKKAVMDIEWAKLMTFEGSMKVVGELNILKVVFEFDCANLVNRIKKKRARHYYFGTLCG